MVIGNFVVEEVHCILIEYQELRCPGYAYAPPEPSAQVKVPEVETALN
jgi:hypothetical protein